MRQLALLAAMAIAAGCATTNKGKTLQLMVASATAGALYGSTSKNNQAAYSLMYAGVAAAVAGAAGLYVYDEEKHSEDLRQKLNKFEEMLGRSYDGHTLKAILGGKDYFTAKPLPKDYEHLVTPGQWTLYQLEEVAGPDNWTQIEKNRLLKKDKIFEFVPPEINPRSINQIQ